MSHAWAHHGGGAETERARIRSNALAESARIARTPSTSSQHVPNYPPPIELGTKLAQITRESRDFRSEVCRVRSALAEMICQHRQDPPIRNSTDVNPPWQTLGSRAREIEFQKFGSSPSRGERLRNRPRGKPHTHASATKPLRAPTKAPGETPPAKTPTKQVANIVSVRCPDTAGNEHTIRRGRRHPRRGRGNTRGESAPHRWAVPVPLTRQMRPVCPRMLSAKCGRARPKLTRRLPSWTHRCPSLANDEPNSVNINRKLAKQKSA